MAGHLSDAKTLPEYGHGFSIEYTDKHSKTKLKYPLLGVANHNQMAPVTSVPEPYNQDWSSRRSVIGHTWFLNDQLWVSDYAVCLLYEQWQQCLKILDYNCRLGF